MPEDVVNRRLPLYAYLEPLLAGRRVLEVGRGRDGSADLLARLGAARVVTSEGDAAAIAAVKDRFDVVLVPEADNLLNQAGAVASWRALLAEKGRLVVAVANPDRAGSSGGVGYYELHDTVGALFPRVQMLGVTPFLGVGLVEFGGAAEGLKIDSRLVKEGAEPPAVYVAVAGTEPVVGLGYALVQLPWGSAPAREADSPSGARAKLEEARSQAESAMRVARAQGDEIEELRARLRRGVEDRAVLDGELSKLRAALAAADESVMSLTRRTAEEMSAVAERLAAGLRLPREPESGASVAQMTAQLTAARDDADRLRARLAETEARAAAAEQRLEEIGTASRERQSVLDDALERLRLAESELARARRSAARLEEEARAAATEARAAATEARGIEERDRAIAARDERVARLEAEKQDLLWRLAELEDKVRDAIARAVAKEGSRPAGGAGRGAPDARIEGELAAAREARERALEGFHQAATAHVGELTELKAAVSEQAALVAELEDALAAAEAKASSAATEASTLRTTAKTLEEADRSRRSRLAELEGKLLRLEHERRTGGGGGAEQEARVRELESERDSLRRRVDEDRRAVEGNRVSWTRERQELSARVEQLTRAEAGRNGHDGGQATLARDLEALEAELRQEAGRLQAIAQTSTSVPAPGSDEAASRLETLLGNYRQRAGRLRDDLEGVRRRLEELSPAEIAGFLEELGEDLAELDK